jgi:hypothetical protein
MHHSVTQRLHALAFAPVVAFQNLEMYPLVGPGPAAPGYATLDEASARGAVTIKEVSSGGSVPTVQVLNDGDVPVLLLDGEELLGAKQNRIVNLTILVPGHAALDVPVSCVEAGRWHHLSSAFSPAPRTQFAEARARKSAHVSASMREARGRMADQGEIWDGIAAKAERMHTVSATSAMSDIYDTYARSVEEFVDALAPVDGQVGAVFVIDGRVRGVEVFDAPATLATMLPKLVRSWALDAIETLGAKRRHRASAGADDPRSFVTTVAAAAAGEFKSLGLGTDIRFDGDGIAGGALVADDRVVHLTAFRLDAPGSRVYRGRRGPQTIY